MNSNGEQTEEHHTSPFNAIRHEHDEKMGEYWSARELYKLLGYSRWEKFQQSLEEAKSACEQSGQAISDHFHLEVKLIKGGKGAKRPIEDYHLTRYGCYLVVMNGDATKPMIALGQSYFAYQTRRQEIADELELSTLPENQKRIVLRSMLSTFNARLQEAAQLAGVVDPRDYAVFYDYGYMGLYEHLRENDIHTRKHLKPGQKISDHMGSEELGANIFRATQTDAKLRRDQVNTKEQANLSHFEVGREVREAIKRLGGTMPENLPTPAKSIQQIQRDEQKRIKRERQPSLFLEEPPKE